MTARPARRTRSPLRFAAVLFVSALAAAALAQAPGASTAPGAKPAASAASHAASRGGRNGAQRTAAGPSWRELSASQQKALAPLSAQWDTSLNEAQKRKWIALSANYPKLSGEEQDGYGQDPDEEKVAVGG